jgi:hypothetical protein
MWPPARTQTEQEWQQRALEYLKQRNEYAVQRTALEAEYEELLQRFHERSLAHEDQRKVFEQKLRMLQAEVEAARKVQAQLEAYKKKAHAAPLPEDAEIKVFALRNLPAENAVETVESLLGAQAFRVAIDECAVAQSRLKKQSGPFTL